MKFRPFVGIIRFITRHKTRMKEDIEQLQQEITHQTMGIFWISQKKLTQRPRPFHALDYFLDGLLFNYCERKTSQNEGKNFFVSSHFDVPFFVGHFDMGQDRPRNILDDLMGLAKPFKISGGLVLVLDFSGQNFFNYLSSKYDKFKFKELPLP